MTFGIAIRVLEFQSAGFLVDLRGQHAAGLSGIHDRATLNANYLFGAPWLVPLSIGT